jgi:hypothetical protein
MIGDPFVYTASCPVCQKKARVRVHHYLGQPDVPHDRISSDGRFYVLDHEIVCEHDSGAWRDHIFASALQQAMDDPMRRVDRPPE